MEQERKPMSELELQEAVARLERGGRYEPAVLDLVREDYRYGLSKAQIDIYLQSKMDPERMKIVSEILRRYDEELAAVIVKCQPPDIYRMWVSAEYFEKGVPLETIESVLDEDRTAYAMRRIYQRVLEETKKPDRVPQPESATCEEHQNHAALEDVVKELQKRLDEKDALISSQQASIRQTNDALEQSRRELAKKEEELWEMRRAMDVREVRRQEPEDVRSVPVLEKTAVSVAESSGGRTESASEAGRRDTGLAAMLGRLARKEKAHQDMVGLVANGNLSTEQLAMIRVAMEKGLREEQIHQLITSRVPAEQMKEIIEIAVLENQMK
ncbi:MAG: hypothetical protein ACI4EE_10245 [Lachnospiraceae bacterium]